jgi:hypothetical protein
MRRKKAAQHSTAQHRQQHSSTDRADQQQRDYILLSAFSITNYELIEVGFTEKEYTNRNIFLNRPENTILYF